MAELINMLVPISAGIAAILGLFMLGSFFHDKLRDLFDDSNYFIFFFMVSGYFLYALGEVAYFLDTSIYSYSGVGIQDIYWSGGAFLILVSFLALDFLQSRKNQQTSKVLLLASVGLAIFILLYFTILDTSRLLSYFYPLMSSLIVAFAFGSFFFSESLGSVARPLQIFFFASSAIFFGDVLFSIFPASATGAFVIVRDLAYIAGYTLSGAGFLFFRTTLHSKL